nr:unnamed protein product [Callosobruchus chinensis]
MDDNARPHRTTAVQQALENGKIARLEWSAMSPDMNPIEHEVFNRAPGINNQALPRSQSFKLVGGQLTKTMIY